MTSEPVPSDFCSIRSELDGTYIHDLRRFGLLLMNRRDRLLYGTLQCLESVLPVDKKLASAIVTLSGEQVGAQPHMRRNSMASEPLLSTLTSSPPFQCLRWSNMSATTPSKYVFNCLSINMRL
jgi:hypothetical protein